MSTGKLSSAAVLRLPAGPLAARPDRSLGEWALLCRVDGRRPLTALAGRDLAEVVAVAERLLAAGLVEFVTEAVDDVGDGRPESVDPVADADGDLAGDAEAGGPVGAEPDVLAEPDLAGGDAGGFPEPASQAADAEGPTVEETRIDSVSLLRELATESAAAPRGDEPGAEEAWEELASRLSGDQEQAATVAPDGGQAEGPPPGDGDQARRPPGRAGDQAAFMREFASLATGDDEQPDESQPPAPESDGEQSEDRSRGGRFGFRKGQRR